MPTFDVLPASPAKRHAKPAEQQNGPGSTVASAHLIKSRMSKAAEMATSPLPSPALANPAKTQPSQGTTTRASDVKSYTDTQLAARYKFIEEVGYGNWGSVWKCKPRNADETTDEHVAVKLVHRTKQSTTAARIRSLWAEFKMLRQFKSDPHPNLAGFGDFIITPSYALIVMDYHSRLIPVEIPEKRATKYFKELLSAVGFLHQHDCTHNDIKPSNILLSASDSVVLCDFGFAQRYVDREDESGEAKTLMPKFHSKLSWGTPEYLAPERAKAHVHDERLADIWSLGVTMYEIVVGRTPFERDSTEEFLTKDALAVYYDRTLAGEFFGEVNISASFESLIRQMVQADPNSRLPSCRTVLDHTFFGPKPPPPVRSSAYSRRLSLRDRPLSAIVNNENIPRTGRSDSLKNTPLTDIVRPAWSSSNARRQLSELRAATTNMSTVMSPPKRTTTKRVPVKVFQDENLEPAAQAPSRTVNDAKEALPLVDSPRRVATASPSAKGKGLKKDLAPLIVHRKPSLPERLRTRSLKTPMKSHFDISAPMPSEPIPPATSVSTIRKARSSSKRHMSKMISSQLSKPGLSEKTSSASLAVAPKQSVARSEKEATATTSSDDSLAKTQAQAAQEEFQANFKRIVGQARASAAARSHIPVKTGPTPYRPHSRQTHASAISRSSVIISDGSNPPVQQAEPMDCDAQEFDDFEERSESGSSCDTDGDVGHDTMSRSCDDLHDVALHASDYTSASSVPHSAFASAPSSQRSPSSFFRRSCTSPSSSPQQSISYNTRERGSVITMQERYYTAIQPDSVAPPHPPAQVRDDYDARPSLSFSIRSAFSFRALLTKSPVPLDRPSSSASELPPVQESNGSRLSRVLRKMIKKGE